MTNTQKVMIIDDDISSSVAIEAVCEEMNHDFKTFQNPKEALKNILESKNQYSVIICDYQMPNLTGLEFLENLNQENIQIPFILVTAHGSTEIAVNCLETGAYDYVTKPINYKELSILITRAIKLKKIREDYSNLESKVKSLESSQLNFIGKNKKISEIFNIVKKVSKTSASVLISGETGTGKELIAKALHNSSDRKQNNLVTINCASIPENLLESELFGHKKGSFTGADTDRDGLFIEANKGTIFLDEIGDMPIELQSKLLRVLQEGKIRRVGESKEQEIDVRVIAATHKNLIDLIKDNLFREDLFFRLNVVNITIPSLKQRLDDIPLLANHFLKKYRHQHKSPAKSFSKEAIQTLMEYEWPGNVRELENAIERACIMTTNAVITEDSIVLASASGANKGFKSQIFSELHSLNDLEKSYIAYVLNYCDGVKERAAEILGINRKTLYRKIKEFNL
ncbi:MAG: hypothetical protein CME70_10395 [Halobacteriovorax sp.]|nr:hypothetical protein [Halobacteriovorax sp.]|tara:strand:+ start:135752 stop:137116 length:1365 start_codon:yes stop_codon:yes gene_type:complete